MKGPPLWWSGDPSFVGARVPALGLCPGPDFPPKMALLSGYLPPIVVPMTCTTTTYRVNMDGLPPFVVHVAPGQSHSAAWAAVMAASSASTALTDSQQRAMRGETFTCSCSYTGPQWNGSTTCAHCGGYLIGHHHPKG